MKRDEVKLEDLAEAFEKAAYEGSAERMYVIGYHILWFNLIKENKVDYVLSMGDEYSLMNTVVEGTKQECIAGFKKYFKLEARYHI